MQKIATRIFIGASLVFGVIGILVIWTGSDNNPTPLHYVLMNLMFTTVCVILPSFALSVAGKYLSDKSK